jgi:hypothetical protein
MLVMYSINLPFWLAAFCAALPLVFIQLFVRRVRVAQSSENSVAWSPSVLLRDARYAGLPYPACWPLLSPGRLRLVLRSMSCRSPTATLPRRSLPWYCR